MAGSGCGEDGVFLDRDALSRNRKFLDGEKRGNPHNRHYLSKASFSYDGPPARRRENKRLHRPFAAFSENLPSLRTVGYTPKPMMPNKFQPKFGGIGA